jgi:tetratricopeptide (TPR) repeat protein
LTSGTIAWAFRSEVARNWHPVTVLTHALDCQLFGLHPGPPHVENLLYHIANALLLFLVLRQMTGALWRSAMVAGLFALHPMHVESVAWVAERKDVLSMLLWLLTMWAYAKYARGTATPNPKSREGPRPKSNRRLPPATPTETPAPTRRAGIYYALALTFFAIGLLCKPMLVTLPFVLLLLDYWPLDRWHRPFVRLLLEKAPFLVLSGVDSWITFSIQLHGGAMQAVNTFSLAARIGNAVVSYGLYLGKMICPIDLAALYLRLDAWAIWQVGLAAVFLLGVTAVAVWQARRRPFLLTGWLWYLGTLVPVIGLVQVGMQSMADRYTYAPFIGIFIALVWWAAQWPIPHRVMAIGAAAVLFACSCLTERQTRYWQNSETLFQRMLAVNGRNYMAHFNLGNVYSRQKRPDDAEAQYRAALVEQPHYAEAENNLAGLLLDEKRYDEALLLYSNTVQSNPSFTSEFNLANALADAASARQDAALFSQAGEMYRQALSLNPDSAEAHHDFGLALAAQNKTTEALAEYELAVRSDPDLEAAQFDLAEALSHADKPADAAAHYGAAERLNPNRAETHSGLGLCHAMQGDMAGAVAELQEAVRLKPGNAGAWGNLGNAFGAQGKYDDAAKAYAAALKLDPNDFQTEFNFGLTLMRQGKKAEARAHFQSALRLKPDYVQAQKALVEAR